MRILNVICSTNPQLGGVIEWVRQFSTIASMDGHNVELASMDDPRDPWVTDFPVKVHAFGNRFRYFYSPDMVKWIRNHATDYDLVISHGLWRYPTLATRLSLKNTDTPYFVYTHGMLDPWFKSTYPLKHAAKWLYWNLFEADVLKDAKGVIFTCNQEKNKARESFTNYTVKELVTTIGIQAPNGDPEAQKILFREKYPETSNKKQILFLGRIHPKKGCDILLEAFANRAEFDPDLHLVFAGPGSSTWITRLKQLAENLQISDRITWTGMIEGDIKWGAFHSADAFILPSHQENFGISVVEALACSVPVLISNKVDIYSEIERDSAGLVSSDTVDGTIAMIERWQSLSDATRKAMRNNALSCYRNRFEVVSASNKLVKLLQDNI